MISFISFLAKTQFPVLPLEKKAYNFVDDYLKLYWLENRVLGSELRKYHSPLFAAYRLSLLQNGAISFVPSSERLD